MLFRKLTLILFLSVGLSLSGVAMEPEPPLQRGLFRDLNQGYVGSLLFRGPVHGSPLKEDGIGILDLLVLGGMAAWLLSRTHKRRREESLLRASYYDQWVRPPKPIPFDSGELGNWREYFLRIQHAWNRQDLSLVSDVLAPAVYHQLEIQLERLKAEKRSHRLEHIVLLDLAQVDQWEDAKMEFATVHYQGTATAGDFNRPIELDEFWTFKRAQGAVSSSKTWVVSEIRRRDSDVQVPRMA